VDASHEAEFPEPGYQNRCCGDLGKRGDREGLNGNGTEGVKERTVCV
jgi:hypothetical protein